MNDLKLDGRPVGPGHPAYVIAELSANHGGRLGRALELVRAAAWAGADAVKVQTYRPDTMTLAIGHPPFVLGEGTLWSGRSLYDLYGEAMTPWEWHEPLRDATRAAGLQFLSSPFDSSAVEFLDGLGVAAFKIASFELVDLALIADAAKRGRPLILSTGMATAEEIDDAVAAAREARSPGLALLRCNSAYPASPAEMDLRTIPDMIERWDVPVGLSDHTLGVAAAVAGVTLGASIVEKHLTLSRSDPTPDAAFSMEPDEFKLMVESIRHVEAALGAVRYGPSPDERDSLVFRRSLFVVADVAEGEPFTEANVRAIRPGDGLPPKHLREVLGRRAARHVKRGTPLSWEVLQPVRSTRSNT